MSGGCDKDVVRVNSDILVEWGEEKNVKEFVGNTGGGRHVVCLDKVILLLGRFAFIVLFAWVSVGACSGVLGSSWPST